MTIVDFDELNKLGLKVEVSENVNMSIPYHTYFGKMYITPEQLKNRVKLAEQIEDVMLYVFAYWVIAANAEMPIEEVKADAKSKLTRVLSKHTKIDEYLENHIDKVIDEVVDTTVRQTSDDKEGGSEYWLSRDRAKTIAENEANAFENYVEYRNAVISGKTKKRWVTENDDKVRMTHALAEGQTVDIDGLFLVGESMMRFPMDTLYDPDPAETINCRCACRYE